MANRIIVVGFDGSPASERALERAATLAGHGSVILVVAGPTIDTPGVVPEPILDAPAAAERDALLERGLALLPDNGRAARTVSSELPAADALMTVARDEGPT
jgi:nucleotide-binding universal stress UspA family protein